MTLRAAIVARVSSKRQLAADAGGRHSLVSQRETLERMAARNGWEIVATFEIPGESAFRDELKARPLFARVLEAAERREFDVLLVSELSRFSRSFVVGFNVLYRLRQLGIGLFDEHGTDYTLEANEDHAMMGLWSARKSSRDHAERVRRGLRNKFEKGLPVGDLPFGYVRQHIPDGRGGMVADTESPPVPVPAEVEGIRHAFERYAAGVGYQAIASELTAMGLRPRSKRGLDVFTASSVQSLIENRFYAGVVSYHGEERTGLHTAAVSEAEWQEAHRRTRRTASHRQWSYSALLVGGLAECAHCGGPIWTKTAAGYGKHAYYTDPARRRGRECAAGGKAWRTDAADAVVVETVLGMGPTDALLRWAEREAARRPRPDTSRQRAALEARRERATDAYVAGARDRGWWQAETARIDGEPAALPVAIHAELPAIGARVATLAEAWAEATPRERHEALGHLFERVWLDVVAHALEVQPREWAAPYFEAARDYVRVEGGFTPDRTRTGHGPSAWFAPWELQVRVG